MLRAARSDSSAAERVKREPAARLPLGVSASDWGSMTRTMQRVYENANLVLDSLASSQRSTARRLARHAALEEPNVLAALLLLKQLELVRVLPADDDLVVLLRALPLTCERVVDARGNVRWLCISKSVARAD